MLAVLLLLWPSAAFVGYRQWRGIIKIHVMCMSILYLVIKHILRYFVTEITLAS